MLMRNYLNYKHIMLSKIVCFYIFMIQALCKRTFTVQSFSRENLHTHIFITYSDNFDFCLIGCRFLTLEMLFYVAKFTFKTSLVEISFRAKNRICSLLVTKIGVSNLSLETQITKQFLLVSTKLQSAYRRL